MGHTYRSYVIVARVIAGIHPHHRRPRYDETVLRKKRKMVRMKITMYEVN
jgi:hypothetical protein